VHFVGGGSGHDDSFVIAGRTFRSRLIVGTGKYPSNEVMAEAHVRSGADMVTVAVRRVDLKAPKGQSLIDFIDREKIMILPNTAACYNVDDAVRTAHLGREAGLSNWVKLEVIGDERTLFPDTAALIEATKILVKDGFIVLPYTNDDLVVARRLIDAGAAAIMPLGAPIGSGMGLQNIPGIRILREMITEVPLIVDAGVGTASDAAIAMELGADGVLMNTAIAGARRHGRSDELCRESRPARFQIRPHSAQALRDGILSSRRTDLASFFSHKKHKRHKRGVIPLVRMGVDSPPFLRRGGRAMKKMVPFL
jgi:thiazole synthase